MQFKTMIKKPIVLKWDKPLFHRIVLIKLDTESRVESGMI